jgi:hypothetical protein
MEAVRQTRDRLSKAQLGAIHVQRHRLGLDEETYRRALNQYRCCTQAPADAVPWPAPGAPCTSSKHLSRAQARSLITRWTIAGAPVGGPYSGSRPVAKAKEAENVHVLPTPAQRALIGRMVPEVAWRKADGYRLWLSARLHLDPAKAPRTFAEAEAIIDGLKGLMRHGHAAA